MAWYYNSDSGKVSEQNETIAWLDLHAGLGWHGPFKTKQDALNYYNTNKGKNPGWKPPTDSVGKALEQDAAGTLGSIVDPIGKFNVGGWFVRIGEILLGIVLIGVGVAKLTGAGNVISKVAKVAV